MPTSGKLWRHVTIGTKHSWKHGDARGWRSRKHRQHSSGDHRSPPPPEEHAGLRRFQPVSDPVHIPRGRREAVGRKVRDHFEKLGHRVLAVSVGGMHIHAVVELPVDRKAAQHEVGRVKQAVSLLLGEAVTATRSGLKPIRDKQHLTNAVNYVVDHLDEGAWVWSFHHGELGMKPP